MGHAGLGWPVMDQHLVDQSDDHAVEESTATRSLTDVSRETSAGLGWPA